MSITKFPKRIYTIEEFKAARKALADGHKHRLRIVGDPKFKLKVEEMLAYIKIAEYYDFFRTYIRTISKIDGVSQLREADATIWLSTYKVANTFEGARFVMQKAEQMKRYLTGEPYYFIGELSAVRKSIDFLEKLRDRIKDEEKRIKCEEVLRQWKEAKIV